MLNPAFFGGYANYQHHINKNAAIYSKVYGGYNPNLKLPDYGAQLGFQYNW